MEGLIILAVLWAVFNLITKALKQQKKSDAANRPAGAAPASRMPSWTDLSGQFPDLSPEGADEAGCVGGSIAHTQHEGSYAPSSLNFGTEGAEWRAVARNPYKGTVITKSPRARFSGGDMRSAVVMAEVLGKPVSMRPRRAPGR